jgi:hypothetical protein
MRRSHASIEQPHQHGGIADVTGARRVDERDAATPRAASQLSEHLLGSRSAKLLHISRLKVVPLGGIMPVPRAQFGGRSDLFLPCIDAGPGLGYAPRPEPVHQDAVAIRITCWLVCPLHDDSVAALPVHVFSLLKAEPLCMATWSVLSLLISYCGAAALA